MENANRRFDWRRILYCNLLLQQIFLASARTDWDLARQTLTELRTISQELGDSVPDAVHCLMQYARGSIAQATGDLQTALHTYQPLINTLTPSVSKTARNNPCRDTAILAAINTALILHDPSHPSHAHLPTLLTTLDTFCKSSANKYIQTAYYLISATLQTDSTIQTKQFLHHALTSATAIENSQITCITLALMSWKFFRGVVGEQAEKSARAGRARAGRAGDRVWVGVTDEVLADTLELQGKGEEARGFREEGRQIAMGLPFALQRVVD